MFREERCTSIKDEKTGKIAEMTLEGRNASGSDSRRRLDYEKGRVGSGR